MVRPGPAACLARRSGWGGSGRPAWRRNDGIWVAVQEKTEFRAYYLIVQDCLSENIARGTLPAGARLTVAGVAQRLNVSRSPVVRAMDNLVGAGVLTPRGRAIWSAAQGRLDVLPGGQRWSTCFRCPWSWPRRMTC